MTEAALGLRTGSGGLRSNDARINGMESVCRHGRGALLRRKPQHTTLRVGQEIELESANPSISIVMPVYNGSKYLRKTLDSILGQTFADYEVICVNDCSTDDSLKILEEYAAIDPRFRILSTPTNQGSVPKVFKFLIPQVRGEYYFYTSQDDLYSPDCLQSAWERAKITGADGVLVDTVFFYENKPQKNFTVTAPHGDKSTVLTNREAVILSLDWSIPGYGLCATRALKEVEFYDFSMDADTYTGILQTFHCNKVVFSGGTFYYRQDNPDAITKKVSPGTFDSPYTDFRIYEFLRDHQFPRDVQESFLLRSVHGLSRRVVLLNVHRVKQMFQRSAGVSLDVGDAERRLKRCFDVLRRGNAPAFLSEMGTIRARGMRTMLASYSLFCAASFITVVPRWALKRIGKAAAIVARRVRTS